MKKLGKNGLKTLKLIHLFFMILWVGGGVSLSMVLFISQPETTTEYFVKFRILQIIDDLIIIPGALGSLFTGLIYSIWSNWGFFKHNWITLKWLLTVVQVLFGTFFLGPWLNTSVEMIHSMSADLSDPGLLYNIEMSKIWGTVQVIILLFMVYLSVFKPFKSKRRNALPLYSTMY